MKPKRITAFLLSVAMTISLLPTFTLTASADEMPTTTTEVTILSGSGTETDPYLIHNLDELECFRDKVNDRTYQSAYVKLMNDIDMSKKYGEGKQSWTPIGTDNVDSFKGTFDGNGFAIKNLYCTTPGNTIKDGTGFYYGLFGYLCDGAIKNLIVSGTVTGQMYIGGVVGRASNSEIINCYNYCTVTSNSTYVGGIVGNTINGGSVKNCGNNGTVTGYTYVSSIIGECKTGNKKTDVATVENCYNTAQLSLKQNAGTIGGIVCAVSGSGTAKIKNCYNTGKVLVQNGNAKGICGNVSQGPVANITQCYYLDICAESDYYGTKKTADEFASGEVAWLLQNGQTAENEDDPVPQVWGQTLTGDKKDSYPVLSSEEAKSVKKVSFKVKDSENEGQYKDYAVKYVNGGKTLGTDFPADPDDKCEYWWSETANVNGTKFTKDTVITKDMTVYGVKKEITEASDKSDEITLNKNTEITPINLSDYVQNKSGNGKNFAFELVDGQTLPDGLEFDESTGKITGKPTKVGTYTIKFNVANNSEISLISLETVNNADVLTLKIVVDFEGEGTEIKPYLIEELSDLEYLRDKVNMGENYKDKYFRLEKDLDMSGTYAEDKKSWIPIGCLKLDSTVKEGYKTYAFSGIFDGNDKKIDGIYIKGDDNAEKFDKNYKALFGAVENATVKNLTVSGKVDAPKAGYAAGIAAKAINSSFENCTNNVTINAKTSGGGVVGFASGTVSVTKCANNADITLSGSSAGGIVGYASKGTDVENCYNIGSITASVSNAGGIVGFADTGGKKVAASYNIGKISSPENAGGIVGYDKASEPINCYYLMTSAAEGITLNSLGTGATDKYFQQGGIAYKLQFAQKSEDVQVWGQTVNETDSTKNDKYPVLTNKADKKVYKVAQMTNTPTGGDYNENSAVYGNDEQTLTLNGYTGTYANKFYGWTAEKNSRTLIDKYTISKSDAEVYSVWNELTFEISGEKQTYQTGTARTITLTPKINGNANENVKSSAFDVKYYEVNENTGKLRTTEAVNAISAGKYLYVISFAENDDSVTAQEYCNFKNEYTVGTSTDLSDIENYDNVGYMLITSGAETAQKPIFFKEGTINLKVGGTFENELTNENGTTPPDIKSSNESVATAVFADGKVTVTAVGKGTATITAASTKDNTTPVYASFTVNVTKEVITVTVNNNTVKYGTNFENVTNKSYTVSKENVSLGGTPIYETDYKVGDGVGRYEINVSGLTSDIYDIEYKSGWLKVEAKELTAVDFEVTVKGKDYDESKNAEVTANVKDTSLVSGDVVNVLVSGEFDNENAGERTVNYKITGLSGKDSNNYVLVNEINGSKTATVSKAKVKASVPKYTSFVYDPNSYGSVTAVAYANGINFSGYTLKYAKYKDDGKTITEEAIENPENVGVYKVIFEITDNNNYELEGEISSELEIKSAKQDVFSIEGISDTVNYGDDKENAITLQTAGAIEGGTVTYEIVSGGDCAEINKDNTVTIKKVGTIKIKATSKKKNYTDKTATKTVVIKPKTITVTAEANERAYDGTKDVDVLLSLNGVLSGDSVKINGIEKNSDGKYEKTATVATADVENNKTVFVNGLNIDNDNYVLAQTSVQTTVDITKKAITAITMTADSKSYDGTKDATYKITKLDGVIDADKDFVTVTGKAEFNDQYVDSADNVTLSDLLLSGTKSGNYKLTVTEVKAEAHITKARVDLEFGTLSFVYDGKPKYTQVTATVNGKPFEGISVGYGKKNDSSVMNVGTYEITVVLSAGLTENYELNYPQKKQLEIVKADQSAIMITGLPGTIDYDKEFTLAAVGGSSELAPKWSSSDKDIATVDENTGEVKIVKADGVTPVTITVTKSDNDINHTTQSASVTFTPVKKTATFRITGLSHTYDGKAKKATVVTNAADSYDIKYTKEDGTALTSGTTPTDAGTYYVEVTAKGNYEGEQIAVMTIRKGTLDTKNITIGIPENLVYGDSYEVTTNYSGSYTITYSGTGINGKPTIQPKNAGSYTATLTINDPNYEIVTVEKPFEIAKKELDVKIKGENGTETVKRAYGEANPVFELDYSGFANNETKAVLLIEPTANTTANSSSNVGNYPIAITGGYDENYDFNCSAAGMLEVTAATMGNFRIVVASGSADAYVGNKFTLGAYFNNEIQNDVEWSSSNPDIVTVDEKGNVEIKGVSETVTITVTACETSNCKGMTATYTIAPQKKHISLSASAKELVKVYNGEEQYINFTAPSGVDLTNVKVNTTYVMTTNPSKDKPIDVGTYMVSYEIDDDCYEGSGNFTLTINKATVTLSAKEISKEYGEDPVYALNVSDNVKGINAETMKDFATITSGGAARTANAGEYDISVELTKTSDENCNYVVNTEANGKLKVIPAKLTVNVADITREYGTENPTELTYTITGFKNEETADILTGSIAPVYAETIEEKVGTQKDVVTAASTLENGNYTVEIKYVDGEGADLTITKIAVNASAGTSRASYLTVKFDKAVEGVTFTVKNGETPVEVTSVTASADSKTYTLNGTFTVGTEYTVEIAYDDAAQDVSNKTLKITPAKQSSDGGGGGGGSSATTSYTVTFETNGGSKIDSVKVDKNKTVTEPTAPTKDGFEFDGWYSDKKLITAYDFDTKVTKAITLYAKWTEKKVDDNNSTPSEWKNPFTDVNEADWFFDNVRYANENGLMSGTTATTFAPNDNLTRAMLVTVLYRAEGEPAVNKSIPFADVNASQYYANAVIWAQQNGIVKGITETEFAPDEKITREQIATIIYRYAEYKGIAPTGAWAIKLDYADVSEISDYAVEGIMYCTMKNIMQGKDNNMFAPKDNATRAEIAAILNRFIESNK